MLLFITAPDYRRLGCTRVGRVQWKWLISRYTLLDLITGKEMDFHASDMKPSVFDSAVVDPMNVARRDYMEYFVDKILQHRGNPKKSSSMEFEVSWLNYPPDSNTWEP